MAVLESSSLPWAFSNCGKWGCSLVASRGQCMLYNALQRPLLLGCSGFISVTCGLSSYSTRLQRVGSVLQGAQAQFLHSKRHLPGPGIKAVSPALQGGFLTAGPLGAPYDFFLFKNPNNRTRIIVYFGFPANFSWHRLFDSNLVKQRLLSTL